ncbi:MAG: peptidoglycan recognition family protein [Sphingobacteriales bacterium]|nr:peptidoglycan recognition family protein [Sphingobacteriales bacterium]
MYKSILVFVFIAFSNVAIAKNDSIPSIRIVEKPISYTEDRKKLSVEYLQNRHGLNLKKPIITPKIIVLHFTDGGTIKSVFNYFNATTIEAGRSYNKKQSNLNVSSHYLIDRDGTIYHLLADTLFARHTIGLNYCAIGVENIGSASNPLTDKQVAANIALIKHLTQQYPIEYVIGHSEYGKFRKTPLWKETDPNYFTGKTDPGESFLKQVRDGIKGLKVKSSY